MSKKKLRTQPFKIGINNVVRVRLTEFGWGIYENYFNSTKRPKTQQGYLSMPFATLMNIFGDQLFLDDYDENISVFVDNEIIYDIPSIVIEDLSYKVEDDRAKEHQKYLDKREKEMLAFKAGDKVIKGIGSDKRVHTYIGLTYALGSKAHEIKDENGRISIIRFDELDLAK